MPSATITGIAFQDFNGDGIFETNATINNSAVGGMGTVGVAVDHGVGGVTVQAFDANNVLQATTTTAANGSYTLTPADAGSNYRVEFSGFAAGLTPGPHGVATGPLPDASGTSVQFVGAGATAHVDMGLIQADQYSPNNPFLVNQQYWFGDPTNTATGFGNQPTIVGMPYAAGTAFTDPAASTSSDYTTPVLQTLATVNQVGATWGLAYDMQNQTVYAAAFFKRNTGFGPDGTGAIYQIPTSYNPVTGAITAGTPTLFASLNAGPNDHNTADYDTDNGNTGWNAVGTTSLGGMAVSADGSTIYVMNLADRKLYTIAIASGTVQSFAVPIPADATGPIGNPGGDIEPFAVTFHNGLVYVGMVNSAESTQNRADLHAYVYSFDPATSAFTQVLEIQDMTYTRSYAENFNQTLSADWLPWTPTFHDLYANSPGNIDQVGVYPQPMLTGIAFDASGNMTLGLRDRGGDEFGFFSLDDPANPGARIQGVGAGDTLRASPNAGGTWTIEPDIYAATPTHFYANQGWKTLHTSITVGGVANVPGFPDTVITAFDPANTNQPRTGGVRWYNDTTGDPDKVYTVYATSMTNNDPSAGTFSKANGMGNVVYISPPAMIEIGDRVWDDTNGNGIQDPGEPGIPNVTVDLYSPAGTLLATALTDANGNYFFCNGTGMSTASAIYGVAGLTPNTTGYTVRLDRAADYAGGKLTGLGPTQPFASSDIAIDSNGQAFSATDVRATVDTGNPGHSDHTFDFGFTPSADLQITKTDGTTTYTPGGTTTYTIVVTNAGPSFVTAATVADSMPAAIISDTWTTTYAGIGSTGPASGNGNINSLVNLAVGGTATFTVVANIDPTATGNLVNTATVAPPPGITDPTPGNDTATDTDTPTPTANLQITKTDGTTTYTPGGSTTYTIVVTNAGPSFVTAATLADSMPAAIVNDNWTATYAGLGSTGPASGNGNINSLVNLAVGGTATFTVVANIDPAATGNLVNTATVAPPPGTNDPTPGNNTATDTDTPTPTADLQITKTDGTTTYTPGGTTTYTIVVTNAGPSFVTAATVADPMPAAIVNDNWTATYAGIGSTGPASGNGNINSLVNLAVGGTATFTVVANIDPAATGNLVNPATVAPPPGTTDPTPGNNTATDTDTPTPSADLQITKTDGTTTYTPGSTTTYTIVVTNAGPSFVTAATLADSMPAAIVNDNWTATYAGIGSTGPASGNGNINTLVNLAVGGTATFTVVANIDPTATGNLVNTATVAPPLGTTDPTPGNNTATDTDTPTPTADLQITKTDGVATYTPGGSTTYTIVVTNAGPSFVTGATVADPMPAAIVNDNWTATYAGIGSAGPASGNGNINSLVNLSVGGTATFTVVANINPAATGNLVNTATVAPPPGTNDPTPINNSATATNTPAQLSSLTGYVFIDLNDNGIRDPGEPGIAGTFITLTGNTASGNPITRATTTDANGFYQFTGLPLGVYSILETQPTQPGSNPPALFLEGKVQNGSPAAATVGSDVFDTIDLTNAPFAGGNYNFGELLPASLSGFVYVDSNNNGVRDPNEPGIAGVSVQLVGTDDRGTAVNVSVTTSVGGSFSFQNMRPGTYTVTESQPAFFIDGLTDPGTSTSAIGAAGDNVISGIVVGESQNGVVFRFGERGLLPQYISKRQFLTLPSGALSAGPAGTGIVLVNPIASPANTPTVIEGTTPGTAIGDNQTAMPFSNVVLADPDANETYTFTVTLSAAANGSLSNLSGGTYSAGTGVYTSPVLTLAGAQGTLRGLIFSPTQGQVARGLTVTTQFTIGVNDGAFTPTDNSTHVSATAVFGIAPRTLASYWTVNAAGYKQTLTTTGGIGAVNTFAVTVGALPAGLVLDPVLGTITGTPTAVGSFPFTITATNTGETATQTYTVVIVPAEFTYNQATQRLTISVTAALPNFEFTQATTASAGVIASMYTFMLSDNANSANVVSQTFPDSALSTSPQAPTVVVNGVAGAGAKAILVINDTYATPSGLAETPERIALGARNDAGAGTLSKFPGDNVSNPAYTFLTLSNFPVSYAYAGRADGSVLLYGTAGAPFNGFVSAGNYSYMGGPGLFHLAQGAASVYGYSAGQPTDFANHYAANAGSAYVVSGTAYSYMSTTDTVNGVTQPYFNVAVGFLVNTGVSKHPGQDYAYILDSPGNDAFVGGSAYSYMNMQNPNGSFAEFDTAYAFAMVFAESFVGGTDTATNNDPSKNILAGFHLE